MKFTKKLSIIIESGFLGTNFTFKDFNFNPKNPNNLKDLGNYIIMIYQILYAERNGLQKYTKQKLNLNLDYKDNIKKFQFEKNDLLKFYTFLRIIKKLINKKIELKDINKIINQKDKFNISDSLFKQIKKNFIIEFSIVNINSKNKDSHIIKIDPFNNYDWIRNVLHDIIHIVINPKTVSKFSNKNFGDFDNPIGYSNKELLEEISALITDVNLSNLNEFDFEDEQIKKIKDTGKIINFAENPPNNIVFPFFLHILKNTIIFNYLKTIKRKEVQNFLKNPSAEIKKINFEDVQVKFEDIKEYFKKYPYFQNILDKTINILSKDKNSNFKTKIFNYNSKYLKNNFYSFIDNIIYRFMQKSNRFLTKKGQEVGKDESKLADFLQHVKNCINNYNKTIK